MTTALKLVRGRAMRATRTNGCGVPQPGPDSVVTSEGFITVGLTSNTEAGEAISVTNAAGKVCISDTPTPKFVNYGVEITFCGVTPELVNLLTGQPVVMNAAGTEAVGFRQNSKVDVDLVGFALELWTGVATVECSDTGDPEYGYLLLPFIKGGVIGDLTVENGAINFTLSGAQTRDGSGWGVGPFDVVRDENGVEAPLNEPIDSGDHLHLEITSVPPPDVTDESAQPLGTEATGATAGTPGEFTPENSYGPMTLADLQASSIVADPATAWTTGQSIVLRDGSRAHWDGSAWVAGAA